MRKLVSANFSRIFKNKFFWICLVIVCGFSAFVAIRYMQNNPWCREQISHETKRECFRYAPVVAGMVALFVNLFLGEEYGSRTIRNKVTAGYSKGKIFGANWLVCAVMGGGIYLLSFLITALPIAPWAGLLKENGNIVAEFLKGAFTNLCTMLAVVSVVVCITLIVKNRVVSLAIVMVVLVLLYLLTVLITGYAFINQAISVRELLLLIYWCLIMVIFGVGGAYLFSKKDLE